MVRYRPSGKTFRFPLASFTFFFTTGLFCLTSFFTAAWSQAEDDPDQLATALARSLPYLHTEFTLIQQQQPLIENRQFCLAAVYRSVNAHPLWVDQAGPTQQAGIIIDRLRNSYREGLTPAEYEVPLIESLWSEKQVDKQVQLDLLLTFNLAKYIHDIKFGQLKIRRADAKLYSAAGNIDFDPAQAIQLARSVPDLGAYLDSLPPQHQYYTDLKAALEHYRRLALTAQWPHIPDGPLIKPGKTDNRLADILIRLRATEQIDAFEVIPTDSYHDRLVTLVRTFQATHGLNPDGIIGPQTLVALNRTPAELAAVIRANLARWRWQDHHIHGTYLIVNIAAFNVKAIQNDVEALELPVIVGKSQHQTPVFSDSLVYLDFNPFWNITPSIARNEELPGLRKNPRHLVERHIRLFSSWQPDARELDSTTIDWNNVSRSEMSRYLLRQDPGPWNALGRVKFVFPNHHSVYLHDTPTRDLFQQTNRSFSHGCIRVSKPLLLALFCLRQNDIRWTMDDIENIVAEGKRSVISLRKVLPIYITYQTAWVDNDCNIRFNADIYDRDAKLLQILGS